MWHQLHQNGTVIVVLSPAKVTASDEVDTVVDMGEGVLTETGSTVVWRDDCDRYGRRQRGRNWCRNRLSPSQKRYKRQHTSYCSDRSQFSFFMSTAFP